MYTEAASNDFKLVTLLLDKLREFPFSIDEEEGVTLPPFHFIFPWSLGYQWGVIDVISRLAQHKNKFLIKTKFLLLNSDEILKTHVHFLETRHCTDCLRLKRMLP